MSFLCRSVRVTPKHVPVLLLLFAACGDDAAPPDAATPRPDGGTDDAGPSLDAQPPVDGGSMSACWAPVDAADQFTMFQRAFCSFAARCNLIPVDEVEDCIASAFISDEEDVIAAVREGRTTYDGTAAGCCFGILAEQASCSELMGSSFGETIDACTRMYTGTVDPGGACWDGVDCAGGYCDTGSACPGSCVAFRGMGDPCGGADTCGFGLFCDSGGHCRAPLAMGEPCMPGIDACAFGTYCGDQGGTTVCMAGPSPAGATCDLMTGVLCDYASTTCRLDEMGAFTCQPFVAEGAPCMGLPFECGGGLACYDADPEDADPGVCTRAPALNDTCDPAGVPCGHSFACGGAAGSERCALPEPTTVGGPCNAGSCSEGQYCGMDGLCAAALAGGATCASERFWECASFECRADMTCAPDCIDTTN